MYAKRSVMLRRSSSYSFFAFTSTRSRTPTLPKSCNTPAYSSCCRAMGVKWTPASGPSETASTFFASSTDIVATRRECPDVVGSRDSIAMTDASTNPSNITRISS